MTGVKYLDEALYSIFQLREVHRSVSLPEAEKYLCTSPVWGTL